MFRFIFRVSCRMGFYFRFNRVTSEIFSVIHPGLCTGLSVPLACFRFCWSYYLWCSCLFTWLVEGVISCVHIVGLLFYLYGSSCPMFDISYNFHTIQIDDMRYSSHLMRAPVMVLVHVFLLCFDISLFLH